MADSITSISSTASLRSFPSKTHLRPPNPTLKNLPFLHKTPSFSSISIQTLFSPSPPLPSPPSNKIPDSDTQSAPDDESILASLPPTLRDIVRLFRTVSDPRAKYAQLLHYARTLPPMDPSLKTERNKVRGCTASEVVRVRARSSSGCRRGLSPSRNNGFLNMLSMMQRKALEIELGGGGGGEALVGGR